MMECLINGCRSNNEVRRSLDLHRFLFENTIKPRGGDRVRLELWGFEKLLEVLNGGSDLALHFNVLESENESLASCLPGGSFGKDVPKLTVGILVDATVGT